MWDASARPEGFQLNWLGHFHASRDSNEIGTDASARPGITTKLARTLRRVRGLQLINIRLIPNTALFALFLAVLCDVRRIMQAQAWCSEETGDVRG